MAKEEATHPPRQGLLATNIPESAFLWPDLELDTSENPGPFPGVASDAPSDAMDAVS
ncbi:MAG: hypothetical protein WB696_24310 [Chthoniobacterales bacterium]